MPLPAPVPAGGVVVDPVPGAVVAGGVAGAGAVCAGGAALSVGASGGLESSEHAANTPRERAAMATA